MAKFKLKRPVRVDKRQPLLWQLDGRKRPVVLWLKEVFQGRAWLRRWCNRLEQLTYELEQSSALAQLYAIRENTPRLDWTRHLAVQQACEQLKLILVDVHRKMPFCRCPKRDSDPQCPVCEGDGWINALQLTKHQLSSLR